MVGRAKRSSMWLAPADSPVTVLSGNTRLRFGTPNLLRWVRTRPPTKGNARSAGCCTSGGRGLACGFVISDQRALDMNATQEATSSNTESYHDFTSTLPESYMSGRRQIG